MEQSRITISVPIQILKTNKTNRIIKYYDNKKLNAKSFKLIKIAAYFGYVYIN